MPESSASAERAVAAAAARALPSALSTYVSPSPRAADDAREITERAMSDGRPARSAAISFALARLAVARTSSGSEGEDGLAARAQRAALERHELPDAGAGEREQLLEARLAERRLLGGALHLDEAAAPVITMFMSTSAFESST